jgi:hypothetical protein
LSNRAAPVNVALLNQAVLVNDAPRNWAALAKVTLSNPAAPANVAPWLGE